MNVHGYELTADWKVSNIGMTAQATKGGKRYFLKRYGEYKMPRRDASTTPKLYERLKAEFNGFSQNRIDINRALSALAGPGGNIILPADWFVEDIYYIEATEFVDHLIEDEAILCLPRADILFVMLTAAGALFNIHRKNIVHSDLKRTNILAARNPAGRVVAKIIDFDRSYFADRVRPDELGGDQSYMSPELAQCFIYDMADEALAYLSTKSDIFSLGLVYYNYLSKGKFPAIRGLSGPLKAKADDGVTVYCCEALLAGAGLVIDGRIGEPYLTHLLAAMLQPEPDDRPGAQEVLEVLKTKRVLDLKEDSVVTIKGDTAKPAPPAKKETADAVPAKATVTPAPAPEVTAPPKGYCAPWAEHDVTFDEAKLERNGYVAAAQTTRKDVRCYKLYKKNGTERIFTLENLLILGLVKEGKGGAETAPAAETASAVPSAEGTDPAVTGTETTASALGADLPATDTASASPAPTPAGDVVDDGCLWEEDSGYTYDLSTVSESGYKGITRAVKNGVKGYALIKKNDEQRFMTFDKLKLLRFVTLK